MHAHADTEVGFPRAYVLLDGIGVVAGGNLGQAVAEMADARDDEFFGQRDVGGGGDPGDGVAAFLDRVDEGALVASDVVEEVDGWHGGRRVPGKRLR